MKKSLNTYTLLLFFAALGGVLVIGGLSLFMVNAMMNKIYLIEKEIKNEERVNQIHNDIYRLVIATQHYVMYANENEARQAVDLLDEIQSQNQVYIEYERHSEYPEAREEVKLLKMLAKELDDIRTVLPVVHDLTPTAGQDQKTTFALMRYVHEIERITGEINELHFSIISRKVDKANKRMSTVVSLYLLFSALGVVFVYVGYKFHARVVVRPINELAKVTQKLAAGDLSVRIPTRSRTEIGVLYDSFNTMAEIIQSNESKLLHFNQDLEEKVKERTSELKSAYASLKTAQDELIRLERLVTLGQIATSVNHEIKTPLNALSMNLQLLKKEKNRYCTKSPTEPDGMDETIRIIDSEIMRISDILDEFVRYARFAPPVMEKRNLNEIIRNVMNMMCERTEAANVRVLLELTEPLPRLMLDENKMIQALVNLCDNAIQAMVAGGDLSIETGTEADAVLLVISDTGTGVTEADRDRIFQPFFTSKAMGLGFGLPIVQRIIEDHGGRISCKSSSSQGTIFEIRLPKRIQKVETEQI